MQRILEWWTAYHDWASHLDSEGRFYIIASSLFLLSIYALIALSPAKSSQRVGAKMNKVQQDRRNGS